MSATTALVLTLLLLLSAACLARVWAAVKDSMGRGGPNL